MRTFVRTVASGIVLVLFQTSLTAQSTLNPSVGTQPDSQDARTKQLRDDVSRITTPDRSVNIANFEALVSVGDSTRVELAIRTAIASDDPVIRGLALKAFLMTTKELALEVILDAAEKKAFEQARAEQGKLENIGPPFRHIGRLASHQFLFKFRVDLESINSNAGKITGLTRRDASGTASFRGDRILFTVPWVHTSGGETCNFDLRLAKDGLLAGTGSCTSPSFTNSFRVKAETI